MQRIHRGYRDTVGMQRIHRGYRDASAIQGIQWDAVEKIQIAYDGDNGNIYESI
jgi:hypothetical protein